MATPITPDEALGHKQTKIPAFVIEAFNKLIKSKFDGDEARITQDDVIDEVMSGLVARCPPIVCRQDFFTNHWLDVEDLFRAFGWKVVFDKPGYNESYKAYWVFSK